MPGQVVVLGAKGRFGRAAVAAFHAAGWRVRALARTNIDSGAAETFTGDAFDATTLVAATRDADVIVNALNPPYPRWRYDLPRLSANVIAAAQATGATVMIPGNVYNYGAGMPQRLDERTPQRPTSRKGRLRCEMEQSFARAGVPTIVLRAGDFIERQKTGNWFDSHITAKIDRRRLMYPGPLDRVHAWAFLPDMARAMVGLAERRADWARFEEFGFAGYSVSGGELVAAIESAAGQSLKVNGLPWPLVRLAGMVVPQFREVAEMSYLWRVSHAIDGSKLARALPEFLPTPLAVAMAEALADVSGKAVASLSRAA